MASGHHVTTVYVTLKRGGATLLRKRRRYMQWLYDDGQIPRQTFGNTSSNGEIDPSESVNAENVGYDDQVRCYRTVAR